jgi:hypothetical protein
VHLKLDALVLTLVHIQPTTIHILYIYYTYNYNLHITIHNHTYTIHITIKVMEGDANLGLLEDHIAVLKKVLDPFSSTNFISVAL